MTIYKRGVALCVAAITLLTMSSGAFSQQPLGYNVTQVEIRPGTNPQFERFITRFKQAAERINWPNGWAASQVAVGNTLRYTFVSPFNSHDQLRTPATQVLARAHAPEEAEEILKDLSASAVSLTTATYRLREDLSNPPAQPVENPEVVMAVQVSVKPGSQLKYEEWVRNVVQASEGVSWNGLIKTYGEGPDYVFRSAGTWASFDQAAPSPQQRVLDEFGERRGGRMVDEAVGMTESVLYTMAVDRPDLSYAP